MKYKEFAKLKSWRMDKMRVTKCIYNRIFHCASGLKHIAFLASCHCDPLQPVWVVLVENKEMAPGPGGGNVSVLVSSWDLLWHGVLFSHRLALGHQAATWRNEPASFLYSLFF